MVDTSVLVSDKEGKILWMNRTGIQDLCGHAIHQVEELSSLNPDFPIILASLQPGEVKNVFKCRKMCYYSIVKILLDFLLGKGDQL